MIVYRLDAGHFLIVCNASNREPVYGWLKEREIRGSEVRDASDEYALLAVQGPRTIERLGLPEAKPFTHAMGEVGGIEAMIARTGYTGGVGLRADVPRGGRRRALGRSRRGGRGAVRPRRPRHAAARGLLPAPRERHHPGDGRDQRRSRAGRVRSTRTSPASRELRRIKEAGPERKLVAFTMDEKAVPRNGMAIEGGGEVTSGTHSPMLDRGIGLGYVPAAKRRTRNRPRDRRPRQGSPRDGRPETDLQEGELMAAEETYPGDLKYHPEHDWARIEGDEATVGITWFAQDALGELVHFEAPEPGATVSKDASYGEVESVKAVSDVVAPLSGEILEVNQKVVDAPETVNEDPYGDGWLLRIRLSDPAEVDALLELDAYEQLLKDS